MVEIAKESGKSDLATEVGMPGWDIILISKEWTMPEKFLLMEVPGDEVIENGVKAIKQAVMNGSEMSLVNLEKLYGSIANPGQPLDVFISLLCKTLNSVLPEENKENPVRIEKVLRSPSGLIKLVKSQPGLKTKIEPKAEIAQQPKADHVQPKANAMPPKVEKPIEKPKPVVKEIKKTEKEPERPKLSPSLSDIAKDASEREKAARELKAEKESEPKAEPAKKESEKEEKTKEQDKKPSFTFDTDEKPRTGKIKMPDEATIVKKLLDLLKTPSTNIDLAAKTENPRQMIVKILLAMKDLGYVLTERSGAERHYKLKVPRQDIPDNVDKLVKIARLVRGNLDMAQERSRDVKNISEEIIGEKPEAVMAAIKVICLMAENKAVTFTSKDEADIKNLELEKDKAIAITEGKYPELRIKLN